jgi:hypothetical protein
MTNRQGMTKALIGAIVLDTSLRHLGASSKTIPWSFARYFFTALDNKTGHAWNHTKYSDYGQETCDPVPGEIRQTAGKFSRWWTAKLGGLQLKGVRDTVHIFFDTIE